MKLCLEINIDLFLFAGFLGSMYSFLQFVGMPIVGALSDVYGRKPLMILCLWGIALSYLLWALSHNFAIFVLARFVGGISKGNISLSMAVISDVTSEKTRGKSMVQTIIIIVKIDMNFDVMNNEISSKVCTELELPFTRRWKKINFFFSRLLWGSHSP